MSTKTAITLESLQQLHAAHAALVASKRRSVIVDLAPDEIAEGGYEAQLLTRISEAQSALSDTLAAADPEVQEAYKQWKISQ